MVCSNIGTSGFGSCGITISISDNVNPALILLKKTPRNELRKYDIECLQKIELTVDLIPNVLALDFM